MHDKNEHSGKPTTHFVSLNACYIRPTPLFQQSTILIYLTHKFSVNLEPSPSALRNK